MGEKEREKGEGDSEEGKKRGGDLSLAVLASEWLAGRRWLFSFPVSLQAGGWCVVPDNET